MIFCEDCGSKVYDGACTWCHEEVYIHHARHCGEYKMVTKEETLSLKDFLLIIK